MTDQLICAERDPNEEYPRFACEVCSFPFKKKNSRQKYCLHCAEQMNRQRSNERNKIDNKVLSNQSTDFISSRIVR